MNTISAVFESTNKQHQEFKAIKDWILKGKGKMVFGGETYKLELGKLRKYLPLFQELARQNKIVQCAKDDIFINEKEKIITKNLRSRGISPNDRRYNDAHLVAIVSIKKVKLLSSVDKSSYRFLREAQYYDTTRDRPVIYSSSRNADLLSKPQYYSNCCC